MPKRSKLLASIFFSIPILSAPTTHAQEMGPVREFGTNGRLYSVNGGRTASSKYYLLSRQRYLSEDSSGYEGQLRIVTEYAIGGYEEKRLDYLARCIAPFDHITYVIVAASGKIDTGAGDTTYIKEASALPHPREKSEYNLYWALCRGRFQRFK